MTRTKGWAFVAAALVAAATAVGTPATTQIVSAGPADDIVAIVVDGVGNGHGRGLSQWGAYGRSVNGNQSWQDILATYYGGTSLGGAANETIGVRLLALDDAVATGVFVTSGSVSGTGWASMKTVEEVPGTFTVYGSSSVACPDDPVTWNPIGAYPAVGFSGGDGSAAGSLGVCRPDGSVVHYRGQIRVQNDANGANRTINDVAIEDYLRGVVPREVSASWGLAGGGKGMHALRAQAVAARSYALAQNRYSYAKTCDSSSCQVYGGAARRSFANDAAAEVLESNLTNTAIAETAGVIVVKNGSVVSTEFSASNGPRTSGGSFPAVDDPWDDIPANPLHRWTRVYDATAVATKFGLGTLTAAWSEPDPGTNWEGPWDNRIRLVGTTGSETVTGLQFRSAFGHPSHGVSIRIITRGMISPQDFAFIGDSVGASITDSDTAELPALLDGIFATTRYDAVSSRCTVGNCTTAPDGLGTANSLQQGTDLVVVELGYNDPSNYAAKIDQVMTALRAKGVQRVGWVNVSTRKSSTFGNVNTALASARARWPELVVLDWNAASSGAQRDRWFSDGVHLTTTGQSEFALWLRSQVLSLATAGPGKLGAGQFLRVPVRGVGDVPASGITAVALNVTAVDPSAWGFFTVWPCGSPMPADASHVNFINAGAVEPNSVLAPVDATGEVCVWTYASSHVLVDVNGWFTGGFQGQAPARIVDTRSGQGAPQGKLGAEQVLRVKVAGAAGIPAGATAVALNVTAVEPNGWGFFTVWPCGSPMPNAASHVNFVRAGAVEPNSVLMPIDATGEVCVWTYATSHVLVDVNGWFTSGFQGQAPIRIVDTREGRGAPAGKLGAGHVLEVPVAGVANVPGSAVAVALNVTAVETDGWGFFTVWPCGSNMPPDASHVNFTTRGAVEPNSVLMPVDATGKVCIWTYAGAHVLVDVNGWFTSGFHGVAPRRFVDTRSGQFGPL